MMKPMPVVFVCRPQEFQVIGLFDWSMLSCRVCYRVSGSNDGIIGCVRGVVYNKKHLDLVKYAEEE